MNLSTRTEYGLRAVMELACNYAKKPLPLKTIAQRQGISVKYLERIIATLKNAGIVNSTRGSHGGYFLAKKPEQITISDCFKCLEGPFFLADCIPDKSNCSRFAHCMVKGLWEKVNAATETVLESITLQDLVDSAKKTGKFDYQI